MTLWLRFREVKLNGPNMLRDWRLWSANGHRSTRNEIKGDKAINSDVKVDQGQLICCSAV